jgi:hypothetical protein
VFWPQSAIKRAADAMRESGSRDLYVLARVALEAAIRCEADLLELLSPHAPMSPLPRKADVASLAGNVG